MTDWINDAALLLTAFALLFLAKQLIALQAPVKVRRLR
jgi:hypothetical protein